MSVEKWRFVAGGDREWVEYRHYRAAEQRTLDALCALAEASTELDAAGCQLAASQAHKEWRRISEERP